MKTLKQFGCVMLIGVSTVLINGCAKDGETGPAGKDGNANVTSMTLTASTSAWGWDATNYWRKASWTGISILTADAVNNGAVMLYQRLGDTYVAIPMTMTTPDGSTVEHDWFEYEIGGIEVFIENEDLSDPMPQIGTPTTHKLVCIPTKMMEAHPEVDIKSYKQVTQVFNIK